jgi:hypothetical protein
VPRPERCRRYLDWLKTLPCAICGAQPCDPAHTGPHGLNQKASDFLAIPLCRAHHEDYHRAARTFSTRWRLDLPVLIARLNRIYEVLYGRSRSHDPEQIYR